GIELAGETVNTRIGQLGFGNVISGNAVSGVLQGRQAGRVDLLDNIIGLNKGGTAKVPNRTGVLILGNDFFAGADGAGNVISGNTEYGIEADAAGTIVANKIGTNAAGTAGLGNGKDGIFVNRADGVVIGGSNPAEGNLIGGNGCHGVRLANAKAATITGNLIGTNGTIALANAQDGIYLDSTITTLIRGNVISGNTANGVELDRNSDDNRLEANKVGTKADGV